MLEKLKLVKDRTNIVDVAKHNGLQISHDKKSHCPFHGKDKHSSMVLYNNKNRFKCFTCLESGSQIDLVSKLLGCSIVQAAKEINKVFSCNVDFDEKPDLKLAMEYKLKQHKQQNFQRWEKKTFLLIADAFLATKQAWIENLCHWWINATDTEKTDFRINKKWVVKELERDIYRRC